MMIEFLMRNLTTTTTYEGFDKVDLVVEAVLENLKLKQQIFVDLEKACAPHAILATNTSTIDIMDIGSKTKVQDRIIGLHYFSPAHVMPLLEIITTPKTSQDTVAKCLEMSKRVGKTPVVVGNCVGFTANRAFFPSAQPHNVINSAFPLPKRTPHSLVHCSHFLFVVLLSATANPLVFSWMLVPILTRSMLRWSSGACRWESSKWSMKNPHSQF